MLVLAAGGCSDEANLDDDGFLACAECEGDCDDGDASVFPDADEAWYDGVDGDGRAEIVLVNGDSGGGDENLGLRIIGDAEDNWVTVRQVWNQHAYSITNVEDDLSIPSPAEANWPEFNSFRQAGIGTLPATAANVAGAAAIFVTVDDDGAGAGSYNECDEGDNEQSVDVFSVCP